jgi:hypothetical protein
MSKKLIAILAAVIAVASGAAFDRAGAADTPATADSTKLREGMSPTVQLLQLMDTDKSGKVSKDEFMKFMEAEFERLDVNKDGELDPKELRRLVYQLSHPVKPLFQERK